jgi:hypothetical protein
MTKALLPGILALTLLATAAFASTAAAQSPPNPPARFAGSVMLNGAPAPAGTTVEARIGSASCGNTTVFMEAGQARYVVDVSALDSDHPGCGTDGASVSFFVAGQAAGSGAWRNFDLNQLNLNAQAASPTATATATSTATTPVTPIAPQTGSGGTTGGDSEPLIAIAGLGLVAAAIGIGVAGRRRFGNR